MESVAFGATEAQYAKEPPFHPGERYPEHPFEDVASEPNAPYALLRTLFLRLGYDLANYGTSAWNPLGHIIRPGQTVVLKPNYVLSRNMSGGDLFASVTHPSILRALTDYAFLALRGEGRIIIADAPQMHCDWAELMAAQRLDAIQEFYRHRYGFHLESYDLRNFALRRPDSVGYAVDREALAGDPAGSCVINLGRESEFYGLPSANLYGADFDRQETIKHHHGETHEYSVSRTILSADTILSVPKMKVHKKVGVTLNLKGLVGINTNKNYLVHYRLGCPSKGGDQLPDGQPRADRLLIRAQRLLFDRALARQSRWGDAVYQSAQLAYRCLIKPFRRLSDDAMAKDGGNWHGNDSAWRMTVDLAKVLYFADSDGRMQSEPQRKLFCLVDGIVGGEGDGPLAPTAKRCGCLVAGRDPFAVDMLATRLMGFDVRRVRQLDWCLQDQRGLPVSSVDDIEIRDGESVKPGKQLLRADASLPNFQFVPHPGWIGRIELAPPRQAAG